MTTATAQSFDPVERRKYLGCSEIAAVMGLDKWKTPLDVYNEKLGLVEPFTGNAHTDRGNTLEPIAADLFSEITGHKLRRRNEAYTHPEYPFIAGHIDRKLVGLEWLAEIKCPSVAAFRRFQRDGLPESYVIQAQMYMGLSKCPNLTYIIFCADMWELATFDIEFDETIYNAAVDVAKTFWLGNVIAQTPPDMSDADKPKLEFEKIAGDVTKRDDETFHEAAMLLREADQIKRDGEELYELAKAKVLQAIEEVPGRYEGAGLRLSYTEQAGRKTFDKKALAAAHPEIDLAAFEKQGSPFKTFRPFFITGEN